MSYFRSVPKHRGSWRHHADVKVRKTDEALRECFFRSCKIPASAMLPLRNTALARQTTRRSSIWCPPRNVTWIETRRRNLTIEQLDDRRRDRERVVVLGSGWAGYSLARDLNPKKYQVVVISPRSYFVFTPLLASTSVGTLEFRTALVPIRSRRTRVQFFQGWADAVDFDSKTLTVEEAVEDPWQARSLTADRHEDESSVQREEEKRTEAKKGELFDLKWDKLIIAVGCYNQTFKTKGVKENAYFLKDVGDARKIRNRLLSCFEMAALPTTSGTFLTRTLLLRHVMQQWPWSQTLADYLLTLGKMR